MFRIVFVCTGNQARSVIAERYVRRAVEGLPVTVESGGVLDLPPQPPLPQAVDAARKLGLDLVGHQSRCLVGIDFSDADLVIGFEQQHVATAVVEGGATAGKTFMMAELVRLLAEITPSSNPDVEARARDSIHAAHQNRLASNRFVPGEELTDPAGRDARFFDDTAVSIAAMCDELTKRLFGNRAQGLEEKEEAPGGGLQW